MAKTDRQETSTAKRAGGTFAPAGRFGAGQLVDTSQPVASTGWTVTTSKHLSTISVLSTTRPPSTTDRTD